MRNEDFYTLYQLHGGFSLPVLVELKSPGSLSWYFTNNLSDLLWESNFYISTAMKYTPPGSRGGKFFGGSWEITVNEHDENNQELLKWSYDHILYEQTNT